MAYVPGFSHDVFVSYSHQDDGAWIARFVEQLKVRLKERLGGTFKIWIDSAGLSPSQDYRPEIPTCLGSSATFLFLPSPNYIRSDYCVNQECRPFEAIVADRRRHFADKFPSECFAFRCPIVPLAQRDEWSMFPGLTSIAFCDEHKRFDIGRRTYNDSFEKLFAHLVSLLQRMHNHATPVFLYPHPPNEDVRDAYEELAKELADRGYRLLPEKQVELDAQLDESALAVFLVGKEGDARLQALAERAARYPERRWFVWRSPTVEDGGLRAQGVAELLRELDSPTKEYLDTPVPKKLKDQVVEHLKPAPWVLPPAAGKPRVYLIYNGSDRTHASRILASYDAMVHFDLPADHDGQHLEQLKRSDGVLLVWGAARQEWWDPQLAGMLHSATQGTRGLCLFEPKDSKDRTVATLKEKFPELLVAEQYGQTLDREELDRFFTPVLQAGGRR